MFLAYGEANHSHCCRPTLLRCLGRLACCAIFSILHVTTATFAIPTSYVSAASCSDSLPGLPHSSGAVVLRRRRRRRYVLNTHMYLHPLRLEAHGGWPTMRCPRRTRGSLHTSSSKYSRTRTRSSAQRTWRPWGRAVRPESSGFSGAP